MVMELNISFALRLILEIVPHGFENVIMYTTIGVIEQNRLHLHIYGLKYDGK